MEDIKKGNLTFKPVIFTIGKPLDIDKYDKGEQPVYFMSSFDEIDEYTREMRGLPEDGIYNVAGVSAQSLAAQYKYGKIMFNMGVLDTNIGNNPDNLVLTLPNTSLLHKVNLRGKLQKGSNTDFESTNISLKTDGKNLLPFKGTPISTAHGLDIYAD